MRNGELLGYTETEIEVIANWARYHQKNPPKKKHDNFVILTKKYREVVSNLPQKKKHNNFVILMKNTGK